MKSRSVIIFILITSLLSPACATRNEYTKTNIPKDSFNEVIEAELALNNKIIEVRVKNHTAPVKVIGFANNDVLLGIDSDGQEVKIAINDIEEAWTRDSLPDSNNSFMMNKSPKRECNGCGPALWVLFSILTENVIAGLVIALGVSYAIEYGDAIEEGESQEEHEDEDL